MTAPVPGHGHLREKEAPWPPPLLPLLLLHCPLPLDEAPLVCVLGAAGTLWDLEDGEGDSTGGDSCIQGLRLKVDV